MESKTSATDAKKANDKTLGVDAPKSQVDVKTSASAMLDPADNTVLERGDLKIEGGKPGSSYPTPEAVQAEAEAKAKLIEDKQAEADKQADDAARKASGQDVTRSAIDPKQESIVHPGAKSAK